LPAKLLSAGFEALEINAFDWLHPNTPERLIDLVDNIGRSIEKIPLLREFAGSLLIKACRPLSV
jgi:hypothetical protein